MPAEREVLEQEIIRISREYAETCADCEALRTSEPYPQPKWRAAWDRRMKLQSEWAAIAVRLPLPNREIS